MDFVSSTYLNRNQMAGIKTYIVKGYHQKWDTHHPKKTLFFYWLNGPILGQDIGDSFVRPCLTVIDMNFVRKGDIQRLSSDNVVLGEIQDDQLTFSGNKCLSFSPFIDNQERNFQRLSLCLGRGNRLMDETWTLISQLFVEFHQFDHDTSGYPLLISFRRHE